MTSRRSSPSPLRERGWSPRQFGRSFRVALAYPGTYRVGMASLGFQTILYGFASLEDVEAGRVFLDGDTGRLSLPDGISDPLQSDLFAFSIASENDYPEVLKVLAFAGFPLRSRERGGGFPPVLAGGIAPSLNPEPLAPFIDFFVIGEGEEVLAPLVSVLKGGAGGGADREALLGDLAAVEGVYVPVLYRPEWSGDGRLAAFEPLGPASAKVLRAKVADFEGPPAASRIIAPGSEFEDLFLLEVNRGCGRGCRFCAAGHLLRPLRHRPLESLMEAAENGSKTLDRFGLLGSAVADHPDLEQLLKEMLDRGWTYSVSSIRLDRATPALLDLLRRGGCRTVTFAPETGSESLRRTIGKPIRDERILDAVETAALSGIPNVKLYFMVGLPTERPEDRDEIPALVRKIQHRVVAVGKERKRVGTLTVSLSCFVPKAWTPFQWHPFAGTGELKPALSKLMRELRKIPNVQATQDLPKWAYVQALLSRGDRRTGDMLESVHRLGGDWGRALRESPVNADFYVTRQRERDEVFPWDFIETGLDRGKLRREYERALSREERE